MLAERGRTDAQLLGDQRAAHPVLDQVAVHLGWEMRLRVGSDLSTAINYATTRYIAREPGIIQALIDASAEAVASIKDDPISAARDYLELSRDRIDEPELVALLKQPDMVFETRPVGTKTFADFLARAGTLRTRPERWTDYFVDQAGSLDGS